LEVNVIGQVAVTQVFLPALRASRGRIVNMSSIGGRAASPITGPYAASKFALEAISDALRLELTPWGISVSIIEPGSIATPIWGKSTAGANDLMARFPEQQLDLYRDMIANTMAVVAEAAKRASPVSLVVRAVEHALTSPRPRTRYVVGNDAKM